MIIKVVKAGNCMMCGKPAGKVDAKDSDKFPDLLFCSECEKTVDKKKFKAETRVHVRV